MAFAPRMLPPPLPIPPRAGTPVRPATVQPSPSRAAPAHPPLPSHADPAPRSSRAAPSSSAPLPTRAGAPRTAAPSRAPTFLWLSSLIALAIFFSWRFEGLSSEIGQLRASLAERAQERGPVAAPAPAATLLDARVVDAIAARVAERIKPPAAPVARAPADEPASVEARPAVVNDVQRAALDHAGRILDGAMARGHLQRADVLEMRQYIAEAGHPEEATEMLRRLSAAINTNRVVPEDPRMVMP